MRLLRAQRATDADERAALSALLEGGADAAGNAALAAFLAPRHVSDVLASAPLAAATLALADLLPRLRQLQPRLYSISSSPLEAAGRVQVTVAVVRYAATGADRVGVCSTFLAERLALGAAAPVYVAKNPDFRLPGARLARRTRALRAAAAR